MDLGWPLALAPLLAIACTGEQLGLPRIHSRQEIRRKIDAAFQQLFHGNAENETVFYWSGENANGRLAYLSDINNKDVRSEGTSVRNDDRGAAR